MLLSGSMSAMYWRYSDAIRCFVYLADVQCVGLQSFRHNNTSSHHLLNGFKLLPVEAIEMHVNISDNAYHNGIICRHLLER
ncbi:hypothetical protein Dsin_029206 [Dipteronia sinensis]|uniref:Uncharacterized protein n=1 Tax=Dipteronia sinensis TaxID=43782 RepID=A0AAD9ZS13_9ROSI|nr:hypothetical protein Dsin_029206 [Dipteronia sinensis]